MNRGLGMREVLYLARVVDAFRNGTTITWFDNIYESSAQRDATIQAIVTDPESMDNIRDTDDLRDGWVIIRVGETEHVCRMIDVLCSMRDGQLDI